VDVRSVVTHRFPLSEFNKAFDVAVKRQGIKIILEV
jgi:threonine dehydrogenase-like Zn-dependent dehydrogenase